MECIVHFLGKVGFHVGCVGYGVLFFMRYIVYLIYSVQPKHIQIWSYYRTDC